MLRPLLTFCVAFITAAASAAPVPPELDRALKTFRSEGTPGWGFTQTSESGEKSLVERYDPSKPEFSRWTLIAKNGHAPTDDDLEDYREKLSRRSPGNTAPNVKDQIDRATCELVSDDDQRAAYRFRLVPGADDDRSAAFMAATFTLHKPTGAIERVELASVQPFSPVFGVKVQEARTVLTYSLPSKDRPTLLDHVDVRIRGRAMLIRSLDQDLSVRYSDYVAPAEKAPAKN